MQYKPTWNLITILFFISFSLYACVYPEQETEPLIPPASYAFPETIDPSSHYMFYLHGKIIEDQGIPAISPEFSEYEFEAILEKLSSYGFILIGEKRAQNTNPEVYARKVVDQVNIKTNENHYSRTKQETNSRRNYGVGYGYCAPGDERGRASDISVVGASKGAGITIYVSNILKNKEINYVLLAICHPDQVLFFIQEGISLEGNVLSIYDSNDQFAGTCQELFTYSKGSGVGRFDEIVLEIGIGHGILYQPFDEWILPTVHWADKNTQ